MATKQRKWKKKRSKKYRKPKNKKTHHPQAAWQPGRLSSWLAAARAWAHPWQCQTLVKAPGILTSTASRTGNSLVRTANCELRLPTANCVVGLGCLFSACSAEQRATIKISKIHHWKNGWKNCAHNFRGHVFFYLYFFGYFWQVLLLRFEGSWLWGCSGRFANISINFSIFINLVA